MPIEVKAYRCKFNGCKKYLLTKHWVKKHERDCWWNPDKKACISCIHNLQEIEEYEDGREIKIRYCELDVSKKQYLIYPGYPHGLMRNCEHWKYKFSK